MFGIELGAPFLIFAPRRLRFCGGAAIACLQILILLTGNYTFFNWLTLALCLLLLDDFALMKIRSVAGCSPHPGLRSAGHRPGLCQRNLILIEPDRRPAPPMGPPLAARRHHPARRRVHAISLLQMSLMFGVAISVWFLPVAVGGCMALAVPHVNSYGLFAVMTTERREIIVEGSNDGTNWLAL